MLDPITVILMERLRKKRIEQDAIPGFMRNLVNAISGKPQPDLRTINRRLRSSGWLDVELDDHTLQLFLAHFGEIGGLNMGKSDTAPRSAGMPEGDAFPSREPATGWPRKPFAKQLDTSSGT
jgi:hypothetical protein